MQPHRGVFDRVFNEEQQASQQIVQVKNESLRDVVGRVKQELIFMNYLDVLYKGWMRGPHLFKEERSFL